MWLLSSDEESACPEFTSGGFFEEKDGEFDLKREAVFLTSFYQSISYFCNVIKALPKHKKLILFDGVCNLCNGSVQYVIKHDKHNVFMFAALQSNVGQQVIEHYKIDIEKTDSILLYSETKGLKVKSSAALQIAKYLGLPTNLMSVFFIIPPFIRNWIYDFVAKNRYKWFGKQDACMIPTKELKAKFLD